MLIENGAPFPSGGRPENGKARHIPLRQVDQFEDPPIEFDSTPVRRETFDPQPTDSRPRSPN